MDIKVRHATTSHHINTKKNSPTVTKSILRFVALGVVTVLIFIIGFLGWKAYQTQHQISIAPHTQKYTTYSYTTPKETPSFAQNTIATVSPLIGAKRTPLAGEEDGRINILLLGKGNENHPGKDLTDTIMIASIDTEHKKIALLSLPRDLYTKIPGTSLATKINAIYGYGIQNTHSIGPIIGAVETITKLPIHYFFLADFDAFTAVIDALGGINVDVPRTIHDTRYPGPHFSYQTFHVDKGLHKFDGDTALKYARSRHGDPEGDFGRAKRQQQILQAIKNKVFSLGTFTNPLTMSKLLDAISDHIRTDMTLADMSSFLALTKELDTQNITTEVVDAWKRDSLLAVAHIPTAHGVAFVLVPRAGQFNYTEIAQFAKTIFNHDAQNQKLRRIAGESPRIAIVRNGASAKTATIVQKLIRDATQIRRIPITIVKQDDTYPATTTIIDYTSNTKLFTVNELHLLLNAPITSQTSPDTAQQNYDMIIVLGDDADTTFDTVETTREQFDQANTDDIFMKTI